MSGQSADFLVGMGEGAEVLLAGLAVQWPCGSITSRADLPFFRPDISPGGADRASVMSCGRSLAFAVGRCRCCHRCCQPPAELMAGRTWAGRVLAAYVAGVFR